MVVILEGTLDGVWMLRGWERFKFATVMPVTGRMEGRRVASRRSRSQRGQFFSRQTFASPAACGTILMRLGIADL
jgi:hypothetical protein